MTTKMFEDELQRRLERLARAQDLDLRRAKEKAEKLLERFLGGEFRVWRAIRNGLRVEGRGEIHVPPANRPDWEQVWDMPHPKEREEASP